VSALARWRGVKRNGRSQYERIDLKMELAPVRGWGEQKGCSVRQQARETGVCLNVVKVYSWFSRARGLSYVTLFFLILIGFKEFKLSITIRF
jgi:hypothetical protein